ncbi:PglL family O-oligosaccharyltransferase [Pseudoduganella namucuonensis]|uniref:Protein glycosylation ligase n=1 Tax=Pseudoduganella namucuonensis TaxID=1035707 RepID=A0A1I7K0P5_9BURK|nr:O-antigen ligase family protein [Pseudoduganella namucuonensis]SFU90994.1 Protein glycosylation ligase [Pseudoduganella namucuonensis]
MATPAAPPMAAAAPPRAGDRLACFCLGLMLSLPFLQPFHTLPLTSFHAEWLAMLLGLLSMAPLLARPASAPLYLPGIACAPAALLPVVLLQLAAGMFAYAASAILLMLYLLWCMGLMLAGRSLAASMGLPALMARLAWAVLGGGLAGAVFGLLQYLQWWPVFGGLINPPAAVDLYGVFGNLAQQNHFADHIALAIAAAGYLALTGRLAPRWLCACGAPLLAALALSGSRSGVLYLSWLLLAALVLVPRAGLVDAPGGGAGGGPDACPEGGAGGESRGGSDGWPVCADDGRRGAQGVRRVLRWMAVGLLALSVALVVAAQLTPLGAQLSRLASPEGALGPRLYLWGHALRMFTGHPWLGVGFDAFAHQLETQLTGPAPYGIDQYAHNLPLQLMAVSGLAGLLAVLAPLAMLARRLWRAAYNPERLFAWGVLGILLIHSMLEQPLFYAHFLGVAALFAGAADPSGRALRMGTWTTALGALALTLLLALLLKTAGEYRQVETHFHGAGQGAAADPAQQAEQLRSLRARSLLAPLSELIAPELFVPADAPAAAKRALNERLLRFAPTADVAFRHAALLAEEGRMEAAQGQFRRAAYAYPDSAGAYLGRFQAMAATDPATYGALAAFGERLLVAIVQQKK